MDVLYRYMLQVSLTLALATALQAVNAIDIGSRRELFVDQLLIQKLAGRLQSVAR